MNGEQEKVFEQLENQVNIIRFTPIQALTMVLNIYKGGGYDHLDEEQFEVVVKAFVEKYM
ncbi:hypothetical protein [Enterococcus avium]|uniref:hypothetical protein n=1 Tax=Enterococcus avium TaxID=33945 RepID=UPI000F4FE75D|nr:hypothetical protein [Enterococcus avium]MDT2432207.1 hypothetical protein [Enterococcus avium]MDT2449883.1 hypothetical protein [Enterococcus avium]MDT2493827.1 hypothetical protein [Enterococcus avium]ROZ48228.1 hypothetical protein EGX28_02520 [Enterococcus avium]